MLNFFLLIYFSIISITGLNNITENKEKRMKELAFPLTPFSSGNSDDAASCWTCDLWNIPIVVFLWSESVKLTV